MNDDEVLRDIERRLTELGAAVQLRVGQVTGTGPLDVALGGSSVPYENARSILPVKAGDSVAVLVAGNNLLVLGRIGAPTRTGSSGSGTWDGSSPETTATIAHGLGATPSSVNVTPLGSSNVLASVDGGADATSFTVRLRTRDGTSPAAGTVRFFYWTAEIA